MQVDGRLVLVTGASSGIGAAAARRLASRGARVAMLARSTEKLEKLAAELGTGATPWAVDCGDRAAVATTAASIEGDAGVPDVLVNCAGAGHAYFFDETPPEELEGMMAAPFFAAAYVTLAFLPAMIRRGSGIVLNIGSPIAYVPWPGAAGYATARWALRGLTEVLRQDLRGTGVKVSTVVPGTVKSAYFEHNPGFERSIPRIDRVARKLTPDDVGAAIVRAIESERRELFLPLQLRLLVELRRLFPRSTDYVVARTGLHRAAVAPAGPELEA